MQSLSSITNIKKCRAPIEQRDFGEKSNNLRNNSLQSQDKSNIKMEIGLNNRLTSKNQDTAMRTLQAKYDELRNRVMCVICVDNIINMVFLCGHG